MITVNVVEKFNKSLVVPFFEGDKITKKMLTKIGDYENLVTSESGKIVKIQTHKKIAYDELIYVGLGRKDEFSTDKMTKIFAKVFKENNLIDFMIDKIVTKKITLQDAAYNLTILFMLTNYEFPKYSKNYVEKSSNLSFISKKDIDSEIEKGKIVGTAINKARTLGNIPSNLLTPVKFVEYAAKVAKESNLEMEVLDKNDLINIGAGGILAVNQGSDNEPRMIILKHLPNENGKTLGLVGKGITFDSGGYNLKPGASMLGMKYDMCGGANVLETMEVIGKLNVNKNVIGVIPLTENMINGHGLKCDDVITMLSGTTVEVTNTDAEGRLILADGLTYAQKLGATQLIDMATLTGACVAALGERYTGVFTNNENFYNLLKQSSNRANEAIWRLPLDEEHVKTMKKSDVADLVNSVKTSAGASLAAAFLSEFVETSNEWIHLDIAGTSDMVSSHLLGPAGATGVMIRTLLDLAIESGK